MAANDTHFGFARLPWRLGLFARALGVFSFWRHDATRQVGFCVWIGVADARTGLLSCVAPAAPRMRRKGEIKMKKPIRFGLMAIAFAFLAVTPVVRAQESDVEAVDPVSESSTPPAPPNDLIREEKALVAPESTTSETVENTTSTNAAAQAKATFDAKFNEYKAAIRDIEKLRSEFQSADDAAQKEINAKLTGQIAHAQSLVNEMVEAAMEAYRLAPNADPSITDLLVSVARYYTIGRQFGPGQPNKSGPPEDLFYPIDGGDQYERALPIIKLLVEGGAKNNDLYVWGFLAAFATNDYELAQQWLEKAQESGALQALASAAQKPDQQESQSGLMEQVIQQFSANAAVLGEYKELWPKEEALRKAEASADDLPRVKLTTTKGEITIELFENEAPEAVANFIALVKQGFYSGSPFHRVLPKFMAQGGAKTEDGQGGPGYNIRCECYRPDYRRHFRGTLSMAHAGRDTGNSQFFLTFMPTAHLNGRHTAFGRVIEGIEVLADLQRRSPQHGEEMPPSDRILKAEVIRDRGHEYKFEKLPE
jgi:cyclophilin family peptidyl-prolyl cis-trans isomerase